MNHGLVSLGNSQVKRGPSVFLQGLSTINVVFAVLSEALGERLEGEEEGLLLVSVEL